MLNRKIKLIPLLGVALLTASACIAADAQRKPYVSIPFVNHGGIRDWVADQDRGIWIQARSGEWYYASFTFPCTGLQFHTRVKFIPEINGDLSRWSSLVVRPAGRCYFRDFTASDRPQRKALRRGVAVAAR